MSLLEEITPSPRRVMTLFYIIYTSDSTTITKLDKKVKMSNSEWKLKEIHRLQDTKEIIGKTYICPKNLISFRTARKQHPSRNAF